LAGWDEAKVLAMKPRPDPTTYLNPAFISQHLAKFQGKAYRFTLESTINRFGIIGREDGFMYIVAEEDALKIIQQSSGNVAKIEDALAVPRGQFLNALSDPNKPDKLLLLEIYTENLHLKMASGNEKAANTFWIPGGYTPDKLAEAIIDAIPTSRTDLYKKSVIAQTK